MATSVRTRLVRRVELEVSAHDLTGRIEKPTQCERILAILQDGEWHPTCDLADGTWITRVPARIYDLKKRGHTIERKIVEKHGTTWAAYRLVTEEQLRLVP